jgi:hypothetical protein
VYTKFWSENLKGRDHSGEVDEDGKDNISMHLKEIGCGDGDWIHLAQDRDQ